VKKRDGKDPGNQYRVEVGKDFDLPEGGLKVTLNRFVPDFMLGENRAVYSRSTEPNNPAAELLISKEGASPKTLWVFKNFPDFHGGKDLDYNFQFLEFAGKEYTGIEVVKDPGVLVVWTGCIIMLLGLMAVFFLSHQKVWVRIRGAGNKTEVTLAGVANKNPLGFEKEFIKLKTEIERSL
jgi:cytochrome c biogenesis protein